MAKKKRSILDPNYFGDDPQDQRYVRPNAATRAALDRPLRVSVADEIMRQGRGKRRKLAVKPSVGDYAQTAAEVLQGLRLDRLPQTGMRAGQQIGPAIGSGLSALYDYASRTSPGEMAASIAGAPAAFGRRVREDPGVLLEMLPGAGTVQGIEEGAQRLAEGDPEAMRNAAALAVFAGAMDLIPGGGKGAGLAVKGAKGLAEGAAREAAGEAADLAVRRTLAGADDPLMVSTRRPTAPNYAVYGNPDEQLLIQSGEALRAAPQAFDKNMGMLAEEPFMRGLEGAPSEQIYSEGVQRGADNLKFIMNELMPPEKVEAARHWYPTANMVSARAAERAGLPPEAGYGVTAVMSPQTPWDINVARLDRLMDMYGDKFTTDPEQARRYIQNRIDNMKAPGAVAALGPDYAARIAATPYEELGSKFDKFARVSLADATRNDPMVRKIDLSGEYGDPYGGMTWGSGDVVQKALAIMDEPSMENINAQLLGGGKVPSFYNNIAAPFSKAPISTIDTHSAGAASLSPGGGNDPIVYRAMGLGGPKGAPPAASDVARTGSKGLYGPLSDMHTQAGLEMGMLPREVQSATWEGVRDLWGQQGKTPQLKKAIADIWNTSSSPDEARFRIADLLGKPVRRAFQVK